MDKKKIICAALISVMALSLAACGNKKVDYGMNGGSDDTGNAGGLEGQLDNATYLCRENVTLLFYRNSFDNDFNLM